MASVTLRAVREEHGWTQQELARRMGVSQTIISLWEHGTRALPRRRLAQLQNLGVELDPTAPSMRNALVAAGVDFAQELANLGYPGLAHYQNGEPSWNPAQLLMLALAQNQLDRRLAEALPWLVFRYYQMDWQWVCREAKLQDLQNRLGFTLLLAKELAAQKQHLEVVHRLSVVEQELRRSLLVKEDTYCNDRMTESERRWLRKQRPPEAAVWNLLSDLQPEHLTHVA